MTRTQNQLSTTTQSFVQSQPSTPVLAESFQVHPSVDQLAVPSSISQDSLANAPPQALGWLWQERLLLASNKSANRPP